MIGFVSAGFHRTLLIDEEGDVWYAGKVVEQEEGVGYLPYFVSKIPQIPSEGYAASCESHHLVVGAGGQVWVWGDNKYGQLGLGTESLFESAPVVNNLLPSIRKFHRTKSARN